MVDQPQAPSSDLQIMLAMVQQAVQSINALTTTIQDALANIYDADGTN
jgi:hypothetical protein